MDINGILGLNEKNTEESLDHKNVLMTTGGIILITENIDEPHKTTQQNFYRQRIRN